MQTPCVCVVPAVNERLSIRSAIEPIHAGIGGQPLLFLAAQVETPECRKISYELRNKYKVGRPAGAEVVDDLVRFEQWYSIQAVWATDIGSADKVGLQEFS